LSDDMRDSALVNPKHVKDLGDGWQTLLGWLAFVIMPRTCQHRRVMVQWATWETGVGTTDLVELRVHVANGPPGHYTTSTVKTISRQVDDNPNKIGVCQVFDPVFADHRDEQGDTWVWLSGRTDSGSGSGNASYTVRALSCTPWVLPEGYDGAEPFAMGP
jgi:hypothetical protein